MVFGMEENDFPRKWVRWEKKKREKVKRGEWKMWKESDTDYGWEIKCDK